MAWVWYILVFIAGACVGAMLMGLCAYDNVKKREWDKDE